MPRSIAPFSTILLGAALLAGSAFAATPDEICEAGKNMAAGKYAACTAKAERGRIVSGDVDRYGAAVLKCEGKLVKTWEKLEADAIAAGSRCPTIGDVAAVGDFLDQCTQSLADYLFSGIPPTSTCDGPGTYSIAIYQTAGVEIGALQVAIDYSATGGTFTGTGAGVACDNTLGNLDAFNDVEHSHLNAGWITLGAEDGPHLLTICEFQALSAPDPADFAITVVHATDGDALPVPASVAVTVARKL